MWAQRRGRRRPPGGGGELARRLERHRVELTGRCYRCEVVGWQAGEVAGLLGVTVAAVNGALQRARAALAASGRSLDDAPPPADDARRELLDRDVDAFERYDLDALVALLRDDATLSMPPSALWLPARARPLRVTARARPGGGRREKVGPR